MSNILLDDVLIEYYRTDLLNYDDMPEHKRSLRHKIAMKRICRLYEKNTARLCDNKTPATPKTTLRFNRKTVIIVVALVFLSVLAGCATAYIITNGFRADVHDRYTNIFILNTENCPETIESVYYLSYIPNGYELTDTETTSSMVYNRYLNSAGQALVFRQRVKENFYLQYYNENGQHEEVVVNGHNGLIIDWSNGESDSRGVFWDNGDYLLEITGNFTKDEILKLAEGTKILKN